MGQHENLSSFFTNLYYTSYYKPTSPEQQKLNNLISNSYIHNKY